MLADKLDKQGVALPGRRFLALRAGPSTGQCGGPGECLSLTDDENSLLQNSSCVPGTGEALCRQSPPRPSREGVVTVPTDRLGNRGSHTRPHSWQVAGPTLHGCPASILLPPGLFRWGLPSHPCFPRGRPFSKTEQRKGNQEAGATWLCCVHSSTVRAEGRGRGGHLTLGGPQGGQVCCLPPACLSQSMGFLRPGPGPADAFLCIVRCQPTSLTHQHILPS